MATKTISPKGASLLRKNLYDFLKSEEIIITGKQQSVLSKLIQEIYDNRIIESHKNPDQPLMHEIVCPKCQGVKHKLGKHFKNYKKDIRQAGGDITDYKE